MRKKGTEGMNKTPLRQQIWSIPNLFSYFRIILIPIFVWRYVTAATREEYYAAAVIIALSGLSDLLDGLIARRFHMITDLGKVLDPIADKLTQFALIICLIARHPLMKGLVVLFFIKELSTAALSAVLYKKGRKLNGALWFGKVSTAVFYAVSLVLIVFIDLPDGPANILIGVSAAMMLVAFAGYANVLIRMYRGLDE